MQQAREQAATAGIDDALQGIGIARQKVAGRAGGNGLLHQIQQALARFFVLDRQLVEQFEQKPGVEQVERGEGAKQWSAPVAAGETSIIEGERLSGQQLLAESGPLRLIVGLKAVQGFAGQVEPVVVRLPGKPGIAADPEA
ncbi:hypothetical protein D3C75_938530 [compost metagenome]